MALRFTVLASGSAGNASLVQVDGFGLLLDAGLGPRTLTRRLAAVGAGWQDVHAVLLTHTHGDHWNRRTLAHLCRRKIRLICHAHHHPTLEEECTEFASLRANGLIDGYEPGQPCSLTPGLVAQALALRHDASPTFGFRLELSTNGGHAVLAYAADLGSWTPELAAALADADILALEFNHDVELQHASGRPFHLIRRILGDHGHLSNAQAAALVQEVLRLSAPGRLRHLVQLHLSRDCNHPELARTAGEAAIGEHPVAVHTACQDQPLGTLSSDQLPQAKGRRPAVRARSNGRVPATWLPGLEP